MAIHWPRKLNISLLTTNNEIFVFIILFFSYIWRLHIKFPGNATILNTYNVTSTADQATFTLTPESNGVVVTCENFDAVFISESARIRKGIITLSGHAESISHNMSLNNEIIWTSIPSDDFLVTGRRLMGIRAGYTVVRIDRDALDFLFEGNLLADVGAVFHNSVMPIIMGNVEEALAA